MFYQNVVKSSYDSFRLFNKCVAITTCKIQQALYFKVDLITKSQYHIKINKNLLYNARKFVKCTIRSQSEAFRISGAFEKSSDLLRNIHDSFYTTYFF